MVLSSPKCENLVKHPCSRGSPKRDCESGHSWGGLEKKTPVPKEKCSVADRDKIIGETWLLRFYKTHG